MVSVFIFLYIFIKVSQVTTSEGPRSLFQTIPSTICFKGSAKLIYSIKKLLSSTNNRKILVKLIVNFH